MVKDRGLFLIDSSSLLEETHNTFLGTPLILNGGNNITFLYGFLKYLLALRCELGISASIVLILRECWGRTYDQEIKEAAQFIEEMGIPLIDEKNSSILDICHKYAPSAGAIYSENEALLQFARKDLCVVRSNKTNGYDYLFSDTVLQKYGVTPDRIPTFLALTSGPKDSVITRNQAVRLIDVFGNLEHIFAGRSSFPNAGLRAKLTENEGTIFARYQLLTPSERKNHRLISKSGGISQLLNTEKNVELLRRLGLHSLTRLLALPSKENQTIQAKSESSSYEIIDSERALKALRRRLANTEEVAIDTESSSRDPRSATLFGIAFSGDNGLSCYVPLLDHDLNGILPQKVLGVIKTQLEDSGKKFIGHNIKYDYLLLRRNGIHLKSIHFDTMLAAFECYGDLEFLNLGFLSEKFLGKGKPSYKEMLGKKDSPWDIPVSKLAQHACKDAETTFQLYRFLQNEMRSKRLIKQYVDLTLPLCKTLGDLEYCGVKVYKDKLYRFRNSLVGKANELRQSINTAVGRDINIESDEDVKNYLLSVHGFPEWKNLNRPITAFLEYLGAIQDIPRLILHCRRLLKDVRSVDLIIESLRKDKVFPIFSQIRSKYGVVTTKQPDFLIAPYLRELKLCFEKKVRPFFRDPLSVMNRIQELSGDEALKRDMFDGLGVSAYLNSCPTIKGIDSNGLLLSIITGMSDSKLINRFLIDRNELALLRKEIESRYDKLFSFLNIFKRDSFEKGFSEIDGKKRYWVGLKSPNIEKRRKAIQFALKWLIEGY